MRKWLCLKMNLIAVSLVVVAAAALFGRFFAKP
jgi:hypothetical protein